MVLLEHSIIDYEQKYFHYLQVGQYEQYFELELYFYRLKKLVFKAKDPVLNPKETLVYQ